MADRIYVTGIGRLVADPKIIEGKTTRICSMTAVTNRRQRGEEVPTYLELKCFGGMVDGVEQRTTYLRKGTRIQFNGQLQMDTYEAKDGQKRRAYSVVLNSIPDSVAWTEKGEDGVVEAPEDFDEIPW